MPRVSGVHLCGRPSGLYRRAAPRVMHDCYVCLEPCRERSPCKCTNLYVHRACLDCMMTKGFRHCPVCLTPLPSLRLLLKWMFCLWLLKVMAT